MADPQPYHHYLGAAGAIAPEANKFWGTTFLDILKSQGKTDPALMNQQLAAVGRDTQGQTTALTGILNRAGLGRSGVGAALQGATLAGGSERAASLRANDAYLAETRKRDDLNLMLSMIFGPSFQQHMGSEQLRIMEDASRRQRDQAFYGSAAGAAAAGIGAAAFMCWVAQEIYGEDDPRWERIRAWMLTDAPEGLMREYHEHGPEFADAVRTHPEVRYKFREAMDRILDAY